MKAVRDGLARARDDSRDVVILDTAGRLHIDEALMDELARVRDEAKPHNVLLVLDAMTGQEAVNVAQSFQERIAFDGVVLTKLDGDARGGAALSVKAVTGKPIKLASTGEKLDQLDWFHPDRMASRILGMGDVLTLIERAEQAVEEDEQEEMEKRMRAGQFTFDDFLRAQKMLKRMGPFQGVLKLIPGLGKQLGDVDVDEKQLARVEAIVLSMTPRERSLPHVIDGSRRQRIARGSGTNVQQVNQLLARAQGDGEGHEADGQGQGMPDLAQLQNGARRRRRRRAGRSRRRHGRARTNARRRNRGGSAVGSQIEVDASRIEEESDLPRRRSRFALAARRQVHRDRRAVQPADGSVDDRAERGEGQGLAQQGRAADRVGAQAAQDQEHWLSCSKSSRGARRRSGAVRVEREESDDVVVLRLFVAKEDVGKVIGRQGRIARALRQLDARRGRAQAQTRRARDHGLKVAALYDVHGMPHALEAVLDEVERESVDAIVFGGDLFLGPLPAETLELVRSVDAQFVRGNCDRDARRLGAREARRRRRRLGPVMADDGRARRRSLLSRGAAKRPEADPHGRFAGRAVRRSARRRRRAPRRRRPHAHAVPPRQLRERRLGRHAVRGRRRRVLGRRRRTDAEFKRTPFDVERAIADIEASGWPGADEFVAQNLRTPPSRREATEHFESLD